MLLLLRVLLLLCGDARAHAVRQVSGSHCEKGALKTNAPPSAVWDVLRCWERKHPVSAKHRADASSLASRLLARAPKMEVRARAAAA